MPRILSLVLAGLLACSLAASLAMAQVAGGDLDGPPQATSAQPRPPGQWQPHAQVQRFIARFHAANTTADGRLTLAQAQAGHMPMIVRNFDAIDAQHKGYVTLQDIQAYRQQVRAMREGGDGTTN
jgi:hypothetical protein